MDYKQQTLKIWAQVFIDTEGGTIVSADLINSYKKQHTLF